MGWDGMEWVGMGTGTGTEWECTRHNRRARCSGAIPRSVGARIANRSELIESNPRRLQAKPDGRKCRYLFHGLVSLRVGRLGQGLGICRVVARGLRLVCRRFGQVQLGPAGKCLYGDFARP